jgi:molybdate transport system substrate-binding protein
VTTSLQVLSAGVMRRIVAEVAAAFHRETGYAVDLTIGTVGALKEQAAAGAPADVLVLTDLAIDELTGRGIVEAGSRVDLARTAVGVGVRRGAPLPDISSPEALRDTLLWASSIAYIDPAHGATSGIHFASVLRRLGIADAVSEKAVLWPGGSAAEAVVRGQAELVVHQMSEILAVEGVTLVGPLPPALQKATTYAAGLSASSAAREPAHALIAYLARPALRPRLAAAGLDYRE